MRTIALGSRDVAPLPRHLANVDADAQTGERTDQRTLRSKTERNSFQAILRVPPQILSQISLEYVKAIRAGSRYKPRTNPWIKIAHICHHWREVALRTPSLWASFDMSSLQLVQELLSRSKATPISVKAVYAANDQRVVLGKIIDAASRIQDLDLQITTPRALEDLRPSFPCEALMLRTFSLRFTASGNEYLRTPLIFDICELPSLTSLTLRRIVFHWTSNLFAPSLTQLVVETSITKHEELLIALVKMPKLCRLELNLRARVEPPPQDQKVPLANLKRLRLTTSVRTCTYLLSQLQYPPTAYVSLSIGSIASLDLLEELASVVDTKFRESPTPILSASMWHHSAPNPETYLGLWTETIQPETLFYPMPAVAPNIPALFQIRMQTSLRAEESLLSCIGDFAPEAHTIVYCVPSWEETVPKKASWTAASQALQEAELLALDCGSHGIIPFVEALLDNDSPIECYSAFPNLKTLHISAKFPLDTLQDFLAALKRRRDAGLGLQRLELSFCDNIEQEDILQLREFVDVVDWDGNIHFDPSDEEEEEEDDRYEDDRDMYDEICLDDFEDTLAFYNSGYL
ncbi:hypothetical protein NLI96_g4528 [Meripilus lineatus]|uniref:F-box domain-containing protein n=1 Tax=Meripilus lineatus TaxID=2056292 RepID=A0AAD5V6P1_9APHY|nr:hypothetical protein NLI96_g4528 [Physisporinus lineatus]